MKGTELDCVFERLAGLPCVFSIWGVLLGSGCGARVSLEDTGGGTAPSASSTTTVCDDPTQIVQAGGEPSGFVECSDGFIHRLERVTCAEPKEQAACDFTPGKAPECLVDGDCTQGAYGSCGRAEFWPSQTCECHYGCASDADCEPGHICACSGVVGERSRCIPAGCDDSATCGEALCGLYRREGACGEWSASLACLSPATACRVDVDCQEEPVDCGVAFGDIDACVIQDGEWTCGYKSCGPCG